MYICTYVDVYVYVCVLGRDRTFYQVLRQSI